jgi:hypothetical protein
MVAHFLHPDGTITEASCADPPLLTIEADDGWWELLEFDRDCAYYEWR